MKKLIHPTYFPSIKIFSELINVDELIFEVSDNYQKQTERNRTSIYSANGKQTLSIPVNFSSLKKRKFKDIRICYETNWQKVHLKSIEYSYRSSPYYEYFEERFIKFFSQKNSYLIDTNIKSIELLYEILNLKLNYLKTEKYLQEYNLIDDLRYLASRKKNTIKMQPYVQVFNEKFGFLSNLSMIDLILNYGLKSYDMINNQ